MEATASATPQVTTVLHPVITTPDLDQALTFYRDLLGLAVTADLEHDPEILGSLNGLDKPDARAALLVAPDGTEIELVEFRQPRGAVRSTHWWPDAGISSITFCVDNLDLLGSKLSAAGYPFATPAIRYGPGGLPPVRVVYCTGPDGVTLTFVELPADPASPG